MPAWLDYMVARLGNNIPCVLVSVAQTAGSVPRDAGARMVVTAGGLHGTIGGGALEFEAIDEARKRLKGKAASGVVVYPLGPELGQCCGGSVSLFFEAIRDDDKTYWLGLQAAALEAPVMRALLLQPDTPPAQWFTGSGGDQELEAFADSIGSDDAPSLVQDNARTFYAESVKETRPPVWLFGAGHVGKAVAAALGPLPFRLTWVDARADMFPQDLVPGIEKLISKRPELSVSDAPAGTYFLVMTHSHPLDQDVCEAILRRGDGAYVGLIGSNTKKAQFISRLRAKGLSEEQLDMLICPIGLSDLSGKQPAVIAAGVAADFLLRAQVA
jgi:xanthine dehydrogenase accessory factor